MKVWHERTALISVARSHPSHSSSASRSSSLLSSDDLFIGPREEKRVTFAAQDLGPTATPADARHEAGMPKSILKTVDPRYTKRISHAEQRHQLLLGAAIEASRRVKIADDELNRFIQSTHPVDLADTDAARRRIELYATLQRYRHIEVHALSEELLYGDGLQKLSVYRDVAHLETLHQKMYAEFYLIVLEASINEHTDADRFLAHRLRDFIARKELRLKTICPSVAG